MKHFFAFVLFALISNCFYSQGLENIILEYYYVSDANDATDTDGGFLAEGSITYRIYVDMAPGYELQAIYGNDDHELRIETSTYFFNNVDRGEIIGSLIPHNRIDENTVALDSWITMNGATTLRIGSPKTSDADGSLVGGSNNDGGSDGVSGGLLVNNDPMAGIPLTSADGLIMGTVPTITAIGLDLSMLDNVNAGPVFTSNGGAWSVLEGVQGPSSDNIVLIAQITTDGEFSYSLNLQLGAPGGGTEQYVASNPIGDEQYFEGLNFPIIETGEGCTSSSACNYDPEATVDDGTCIEPTANCQACNAQNDGLIIVDSDGDGICNAEEIAGCTSSSACNYNNMATDDNGSCIEPIANCQICNETNDGLVIVDTDGDGTCDAEENPGCNNPLACNFDPFTTGDDGSCIVPVANCTICNSTNDGLDLVDTDGDGVCDLEEVGGCTNELACNYDPGATEEDDSCILPVENCLACNENNSGLVLVDTDGDGICNAQEIAGCTSETACNYNSEATDEDGSCIEPIANCYACNENNNGLVIIDSDNDGICDAEENLGCTSETACNYDPNASNDDGSCIEPIEDCFECNSNNTGLVIIDTDSDGICDGEEIPGCTDPLADNYNPEATDDDGSCTYTSGGGCNPEMGLEDLLVEVYYVSDENDSNDEDGGSDLAQGSVTYRIYADLAPGYEVQAVFGNSDHELRIETTTYFYNNADRGEETGDAIDNTRLDENTVALDSWLTMGPASDAHWGVIKSEDTDGSIVGGENNDGGSEGISGGLLVNADALAGIPLVEADGLLEGTIPSLTVVGMDISAFGNENGGPIFTSNGGAWSVLEGVQGPTETNKVLLAQITTDGTLCFELNLQIGDPQGGTVQFVAENPIGDQIQCDALVFCSAFGCTDPIACNYDPNATFDNGSCLIPEENCYECNEDNTALVIIDSDGDGICDAFDFIGESSAKHSIELYPNPSSSLVNIKVDTEVADTFEIKVINVLGELVHLENVGLIANQKRFTLDVSTFADGIYEVQIISSRGQVSKTLLKTK
jgi:hypothetical protein